MPQPGPKIIVLGAAGLIGNFIALDLIRRQMATIAIARRFTGAQLGQLRDAARETQVTRLDVGELTRLLQESDADVVVNCLGVLQDMPGDSTRDIHLAFVKRLLDAIRGINRPMLFVHLSIPGIAADDRTSFSRSKRDAEQAIVRSGLPYVILRPGFVFAPAAFGGSAMLRALAALPFGVPAQLSTRQFAIVSVEDIAETVRILVRRWPTPDRKFAAVWDLMHPHQRTLGDAIANLRAWLGTVSQWRISMPMVLLKVGAWAGDFASWLGWRPPLRSTALAELLRGVSGEPRIWIQTTGIEPHSLEDVLNANPATVQEKWFARLYQLKALVIAILSVFWCVSAVIALTVAYPAAVAILTGRGYSDGQAQFMTVAGSVMDFAIGVAIAVRPSNRWGLLVGVAVSLFYMIAAAILTPELWTEPLGALVKTGPAIVLMLVALAISDER